MPVFPDSGRCRGMANITFSTAEEAAAALGCNGADFNGRSISVEVSQPRENKKDAFKAQGDKEPSTSCFIGNLSWDITEEVVRETFSGEWPTAVGTRARLHCLWCRMLDSLSVFLFVVQT